MHLKVFCLGVEHFWPNAPGLTCCPYGKYIIQLSLTLSFRTWSLFWGLSNTSNVFQGPESQSYAPHTKQQRGCFEGPFSAHQLTLMGCQPLSLPVSDICPNMICNPRRKSTQVEMFPRENGKKEREKMWKTEKCSRHNTGIMSSIPAAKS